MQPAIHGLPFSHYSVRGDRRGRGAAGGARRRADGGEKIVALRMARLPAIAVKQNKEAINRTHEMRRRVPRSGYGQEMFRLTAMAHSPEGQEFRGPQTGDPMAGAALQVPRDSAPDHPRCGGVERLPLAFRCRVNRAYTEADIFGLPSVATDRSTLPAEDRTFLLRRGRQFLTRSRRSCLAPRHSNRRVWAIVGDGRLPRTYWHY